MNNLENILLRLIKLKIANGAELEYMYKGDYNGNTVQTRKLQSERYTYRRYQDTQTDAQDHNQRAEKP